MKTKLVFVMILFVILNGLCISPAIGLAARDGGYDVTSSLWAKAVLQVSTSPVTPVTLRWKAVGTDITPSGDQVISGYFYADPADFVYGSQYNPEVFVKIYIATNGWCNIAFNHVTVDPVIVYSAHNYSGMPNKSGSVTLSGRLAEHQYDGVSIDTSLGADKAGTISGSALAGTTTGGGYDINSGLWAAAALQPVSGPITLVWKAVGIDTTATGARVVSGYFYADPNDFAYGSEFNPEVFVKIYIDPNGWANIAFNHVTVDNVTLSSAHNYGGQPDQSGTATLIGRLLEHSYEGVIISEETEPAFDYGTLTQSVRQVINSASGGSVALDGAMLSINPGILSESAEVALYAISVPTENLAAGDGAYCGQTLLSDTSYLIGVDRDVTLSGPITLTLPIDVTKLPSNVQLSQLHISTVNGGVIIPQGAPDAFDKAAGTMTFSFSPPFLRKDFTHQAILQPPQAAGLPFLAVLGFGVAKLTAIAGVSASLLLNPVITTVDDLTTTFTFSTHNSAHFNVSYRGANVTIGHAIDIANALEHAYDLFVTQMGFSLPNYVNLDFQYTVYLDDFNNHYYFKAIGATDAEGLTLPGSTLFEGASYVNNRVSADKWVSTAVHEYFHALQYGVLDTVTPNLFQSIIFPESSWLFEGSATALSGRVVYGQSNTPARDTQLGLHLAQGKSLFDPEQTPAADVAQDFFYYLETAYGNVTFYRPMFEALGLELGSAAPTSVSAADQVLRGVPPIGAENLSNAWYSFIKDMAVENIDVYGGNVNAETKKTLTSTTTSASHSQNLPPLSYYIIDFDVQKFDANQPAYNQPRDVKLKIALTSSGNLTGKAIIDAKKGGQWMSGFPKETPLSNLVAFEEMIADLRSDKAGWIRVVLINDALERQDAIAVTVTAGFDAVEEAGYHIFYISYSGYSYSASSELKVKNLTTQSEWSVGQGLPLDLSASGYVIWQSASDAVMVTSAWGKGATLDLTNTPACRALSYIDEETISITDAGRLYYPGTYEYVYTDGGLQAHRTNNGIVSCLGDGSGFVDVRFDYNQSGGQIDSIDSFWAYEVKVAKEGRPIVFEAGDSKLGVVDTSGAGFKWLTTEANLSFSDTGWASNLRLSDNGERITFTTQVAGDHHLIAMPTAGGTPIDLSKSTGLELWGSGASLSPDGDTVLVGYNDTTDVGLVMINASSGAIIRKISALAMGVFPAGSDSPPQYTPDGQFIVIAGYKMTGAGIESNPDIFMMNTDGTGVRNLTSTPNNAELKALVR